MSACAFDHRQIDVKWEKGREEETYERDSREEVNVIKRTPALCSAVCYTRERLQDAMVNYQSIEDGKGGESLLDNFWANLGVC